MGHAIQAAGLLGALGVIAGCASFDGKLVPMDRQTAYQVPETADVSRAPISVYFEKPEVIDQDDERDFTPVSDTFATSYREALMAYICQRGVFARCTAERHEGDYRLRVQVLVADYRQAHGGMVGAVLGGVLLPPLLGMAWSFPLCLGTCKIGVTMELDDPTGKQIWKKVQPPDGGLMVCMDGNYLSGALRYGLEGNLTDMSLAAVAAENEARRARDLVARPAEPAAPARQEVLAVFDVQDSTKRLSDDVLLQLTDYLSTAMTATGRFSVVPREQLRGRLVDEKTKSYKACYDAACQIELGRAVAAQKSLFVQLLKVGARCSAVAKLYDLKSETAVAGAMVDTGCEESALLDAMREVANRLNQAAR